MKKIKFTINNKQYTANQGETILDVALKEGIDIPHLCKHPDLSIKANCRTCLVEVEGMGIVTSCSTQVEQGMKVKLDTPKVMRARKINLELIFAAHIEKCKSCLYEDNCILLKYAQKYGLKISRFEDRKKHYPIWQFGDSIQFDSSKCIDCRNCVEVCKEKQACDFYEVAERGVETVVKLKGGPQGLAPSSTWSQLVESSEHNSKNPTEKKDSQAKQDNSRCNLEPTQENDSVDLLKNDVDKFDCVYCGQCVVHCPVGAISGVPHWQDVEKLLEDHQGKILIAQIAPSIRVSIGEEFGQEPGQIVTGQLAASIKKIGFDYVFDVNLGADVTTYEEARELIEWLRSGKDKPMFTSCCPGWVKFVEFYYPEFISHLTSTNPPQICSGSMIKTYFADYLKKDPQDIIVISIMPCTAKKHEINLEKFTLNKVPIVDYVLTTREYAYLLHKHKIDLPNLKPVELDKPLGIYSGAGAIYGATGGVMESALRSADYFFRVLDEKGNLDSVFRGELVGQKTQSRFNQDSSQGTGANIQNSRIEFKEVRGMQGIKTAEVKIVGRKLRVAIVNGLGNAKKILDDLQNKKIDFDYVEVMACPGGCIGGGGQPIPVNSEIRAKRATALYEISKNLPIRTAHENPSVLEIYKKYFKGDKDLIEKVLHSGFKSRAREGYCTISNS